ncbi:MAG: hypothetical protein ABUL62_29610 [Myxococcales bacterium]
MMSEDQSRRPQAKSEADQTLLGVAPPRIDSSVDTSQRAPVYVRSGTSVADSEAAPLSRAGLPSQPLGVAAGAPVSSSALPSTGAGGAFRERVVELARRQPALWMVLTPALLAGLVILAARHAPTGRAVVTPINSAELAPSAAPAVVNDERVAGASIAELEAKPAESLSARELVLVAEARSQRQQAAASALRRKIENDPALAKDNAVTSDLARFAADERTARDALAGMAALEAPVGADLLYETWTATAQRSDATDLARALLYSSDVRSKASPALSVALTLRVAESCEQYQAVLPQALKDGDRRSLHLLTKLNAKRGCGPKKAADCYACLREHGDELTATINAVKSRRPPSYAAQ